MNLQPEFFAALESVSESPIIKDSPRLIFLRKACSKNNPGLGFLQTSGSNEWQCSSIFKGDSIERISECKAAFSTIMGLPDQATVNVKYVKALGDHKPPMCSYKSKDKSILWNNRTKIQKIKPCNILL